MRTTLYPSNTLQYEVGLYCLPHWTDRKHLDPPTMAISDILGGTSLFPGLSITFLLLWGLFLHISYGAMWGMRTGHGLGESLASAGVEIVSSSLVEDGY